MLFLEQLLNETLQFRSRYLQFKIITLENGITLIQLSPEVVT